MNQELLSENTNESVRTNFKNSGVDYFLKTFDVSPITIHTIFYEIETMIDNQREVIEWGMFLIRYVPELIILINKLDLSLPLISLVGFICLPFLFRYLP